MDTTVNTSLLPTHSEFLPLSIQEQSCLEDFHAELATFSEFQTKLNFLYHQFKTLHAHVSVLTESELSKFHAAARCIQKHWRGYAVRRQFTSPGPNRRHASRWLRKKNGRDLDLQKEIQSLHALLQQSLAWQSKHEKFIQLLACKLIQHHWRQRQRRKKAWMDPTHPMNVNHEPFPLTYDHRSVSSLSLGDFNYLKAEVDYLRTTVEAMQLHFQTSLPSFHS